MPEQNPPPLIETLPEARMGYHRLEDGATLRYAIMEPPASPRATLLIAPGRREFIEKKQAEVCDGFMQRGFRVICFEWRGHGLSDRFLRGANRQRDHAVSFDRYLRDLNSLYEDIVRPEQTGPLVLHGHSMGAHLLLRWLQAPRDAAPVAGAILTAPMLALGPRWAHIVTRGVCKLALKLGKSEDYGPFQHDYGPKERAFHDNRLTHDPKRFSVMESYFGAYPDLTVGGVTWGWLHAALESMREGNGPDALARAATPILTITGEKDGVTPAFALRRYLDALPRATNVFIPGAWHDVMNEADTYRLEAWRQIDAFLAGLGV